MRYRKQNSKCGRLSPVSLRARLSGWGKGHRERRAGQKPGGPRAHSAAPVRMRTPSAGKAQEQRPPQRDEHPSTKLLSYIKDDLSPKETGFMGEC